MEKGRLEAFCDGVIAIIVTIMLLELKVPHGADFAALAPKLPIFLGYVLSFIYVGIYWNNHYHLFQATALYGVVLALCAIAYLFLQCAIINDHGRDSRIAAALGADFSSAGHSTTAKSNSAAISLPGDGSRAFVFSPTETFSAPLTT